MQPTQAFPKWVIPTVVVVLLGLGLFMKNMSVHNEEVSLRNRYNAVVDGNKIDFDTMVKTISQTGQVSTEYSKQFKDAYTSILQGTGDTKQASQMLFMSMNMRPPQLDSALFRKVQDVIISERARFNTAQKDLRDIKREHDNLLSVAPNSWFLRGVQPLPAVVVTSTKTEKAFTDGKDDDTQVFGK